MGSAVGERLSRDPGPAARECVTEGSGRCGTQPSANGKTARRGPVNPKSSRDGRSEHDTPHARPPLSRS